ncbi:Uma2 family endonuclease [Nocardia sp.]|uniref:Uma2 family endonuclease n=1 Tax=Nocardia sp. TaxID=1821 RepID=UPI0026213D4E|nr:Uma2 family endonuclease [Nocardia sp.]
MHVPESDRWIATDLDHLPANGLRYEVLNGQLIVNAAPKPRHQLVVKWLERALDSALPAGYFSIQGVGILIGDDEPIPDLIVGTGSIPLDDRGIPVGQIALAVEVVSRSTTLTDRMVKPALYSEAKIPNYWRIETSRFKGQLPGESVPVLFAFVLDDDGEYQLAHRAPAGAKVTLHSPFEFTVDPATLLP